MFKQYTRETYETLRTYVIQQKDSSDLTRLVSSSSVQWIEGKVCDTILYTIHFDGSARSTKSSGSYNGRTDRREEGATEGGGKEGVWRTLEKTGEMIRQGSK